MPRGVNWSSYLTAAREPRSCGLFPPLAEGSHALGHIAVNPLAEVGFDAPGRSPLAHRVDADAQERRDLLGRPQRLIALHVEQRGEGRHRRADLMRVGDEL